MKEWFCIQIDHPRLVRTIDVTFRNMLVHEYRELGQPANCRVYRKSIDDGTRLYLFPPVAVEHLGAFVNFWDGIPIPEPRDLEQLEVVI